MSQNYSDKIESTKPIYKEEKHRIYLEHLKDAVRDPENRNIGIIGQYGVGKSSIIQEFAKNNKDKTQIVSIPSFGAEITDFPNEKEVYNSSKSQRNLSISDYIQKEILKQLIYGTINQRKNKDCVKNIWATLLTATVLWFIVWFINLRNLAYEFGSPFADLFNRIFGIPGLFDGYWVTYIIFLALSYILFFPLETLSYIKNISHFQASSVSITLNSNNHFDQNLEKIINFFKDSGKRYIIFEDLDRFNNIEIFEQLKHLNTVINTAINQEDSVRFIYTLRESSLTVVKPSENKSSAQVKSSTNNPRNKFFDYSFAILPPISPLNSSGLLEKKVSDYCKSLPENVLNSDISQYIIDYRAIINIYNDFVTHYEILKKSSWFSGDNQEQNQDLLLLMIYKNCNPSDYELFIHQDSSAAYYLISDLHEKIVLESEINIKSIKRLLVYKEASIQDEMDKISGGRLAPREKIASLHQAQDILDSINIDLYGNDLTQRITHINSLLRKLKKLKNTLSAEFDIDIKNTIEQLSEFNALLQRNALLKNFITKYKFSSGIILFGIDTSSASSVHQKTMEYIYGKLGTLERYRYELSKPEAMEALEKINHTSLDYDYILNKNIMDCIQSTEKPIEQIGKIIHDTLQFEEEISNLFFSEHPSVSFNLEDPDVASAYSSFSRMIVSLIKSNKFGGFIINLISTPNKGVLELAEDIHRLHEFSNYIGAESTVRFIISIYLYAEQLSIIDENSVYHCPEAAQALLLTFLLHKGELSEIEMELGNFIEEHRTAITSDVGTLTVDPDDRRFTHDYYDGYIEILEKLAEENPIIFSKINNQIPADDIPYHILQLGMTEDGIFNQINDLKEDISQN